MNKPRYLELRYKSGASVLVRMEDDVWQRDPSLLECEGRIFVLKEETRAYPLPVFNETSAVEGVAALSVEVSVVVRGPVPEPVGEPAQDDAPTGRL